jgi:hypothetical protein
MTVYRDGFDGLARQVRALEEERAGLIDDLSRVGKMKEGRRGAVIVAIVAGLLATAVPAAVVAYRAGIRDGREALRHDEGKVRARADVLDRRVTELTRQAVECECAAHSVGPALGGYGSLGSPETDDDRGPWTCRLALDASGIDHK